MNTSTKHVFLALAITSFLGSCSRPVATFQPSKAERFYSAQKAVTPVAVEEATVTESVAVAPVAPETVTETAPAPVAATASINEALTKAEAYASTNARPADARKLERRITKIREVLATSPQKAAVSTEKTQKSTLVQRMMQKSLDKKIQKHLAPEQPMRSSTLTAGLVIGLIGILLLLLTSGTAATIGLIALVVGIVLVILGLI
ncbi:hypothetical protein [Fibrella aquatica]|jgi:hypothetical protein|uniref:hypothetical protein n=1 Tax=Fibrella aquatica TaxID=3242487 RepID=UPI0035201E81